jgi:carboxyl-terminal processing protease
MPFKVTRRAVIVGETTGGSSGQPYMLDLGQGMMILVGAKRELFPDGSPFEGVGIRPDVEIGPSVEDLRARKDTVLEAARRHMAQ